MTIGQWAHPRDFGSVWRGLSGRARAITKTVGLSIIDSMGDSKLRLLDSVLRIMRVVILIAIWHSVLDAQGAGGLTMAQILTYALVAELFAEQLNCSSEFGEWLWEGEIVNKMLHPLSLVGQLIARMAGGWTFGLITVSIPIVALSPLLGVDPRPDGLGAILLFVPSLALSITIGLAIDFILGIMIVAFNLTLWIVGWLRSAVAAVLAGTVIPLAILPWGLGEIFRWLPFASMGSTPLLIYTGAEVAWPLMVTQVSWAVLLWLLAAYLWRQNRERLVSFGG